MQCHSWLEPELEYRVRGLSCVPVWVRLVRCAFCWWSVPGTKSFVTSGTIRALFLSFVEGNSTDLGAMSFVTFGAFRALCTLFSVASFTNYGVVSVVGWAWTVLAWAENVMRTGSVAFCAQGVSFAMASRTNSGTLSFK